MERSKLIVSRSGDKEAYIVVNKDRGNIAFDDKEEAIRFFLISNNPEFIKTSQNDTLL